MMDKRWFKTLLPLVVLLAFVMLMTSDWYWKIPRGPHNDVAMHIEQVRTAVLAEDWQEAEEAWRQLDAAWRFMITRLQFSVERDEIRGLTLSLARLRGALQAADRSGALVELAAAEEHWHHLGK